MTSVRLHPIIKRSLKRLSKITGRRESDLIRQAVQMLASQAFRQSKQSPNGLRSSCQYDRRS